MKQLPQKAFANYTEGIWFVHEDELIIIRTWLSLMSGKEKVYANDDLMIDTRNVTSMSSHFEFKYKGDSYDIEVGTRDFMGTFYGTFFRNGELLASYSTKLNPNTLTLEVVAMTDTDSIKEKALTRFRENGQKHLNAYDLEDAKRSFGKVLALDPQDSQAHFFIACVCSLQEDLENCYLHLEEALRLELKGRERILTDDHLAYFRIQPEFEGFREKYEL